MDHLTEQDAGLLEQAASMLEGLANDERNRGNCSSSEGAACSAHAIRRLAPAMLRAGRGCLAQIEEPAGAAPAAVAGPAPKGWRLVPATPTRDWIAAVADGGYEDCDCASLIADILSRAPAAPALEAPGAREVTVERYEIPGGMRSALEDVISYLRSHGRCDLVRLMQELYTAISPWDGGSCSDVPDALVPARPDAEYLLSIARNNRWPMLMRAHIKSAALATAPALEAPAAPARIVADALIRLDAIYREEADCDEPPQRPDWLVNALHLAAAAPQDQTDAQCVAAWRQKMQDEREGDAVVAMAFDAGRRAAAAPQAPAAPWKDHLTARLVNDLRDCAIKYHGAGQLRERIAHIVVPLCDQLKGALAAPAAPAVDALGERDAAFEAVRKRLCGLQRYSFVLDDDGVVRRAQDRTGNWIEFDDAHALFDPVAVDAARAAQAKEGGDQ